MANKTVARSAARKGRSKGTPRSGTRAARSTAPRRKAGGPAKRRNQSLVVYAGLGCGRAARAIWLTLARGAGTAARSVG
ncbi:MAG: hypothetical protein WA317_21790, partial [Mycobacterium sp.]|uniref:hypothetical protein n=1 Tax=Mycobacterium sp. TaxID=1785 RepID=UPI003CC59DEB